MDLGKKISREGASLVVSLSDLSDTLQASKMTVINHYKRLIKRDKDLRNESKKINNKRFFSNHLSKLIMKSFKVTRAKGSTLQNKDVLITKIHAQEVIIDNLRAENTRKDDQLTSVNGSNHHLEKLLNQQQQLELSKKHDLDDAKEQVRTLQGKLQDVKPVTPQKPKVIVKKVPVKEPAKHDAPKPKHTVWWYIFHPGHKY